MTAAKITATQTRDQIKFDAALAIRAILDKARSDYGPTAYDDDAIEESISSLVFDD